MWLLGTRDFRLKDFMEGSVPQYAILSHTWLEEEVTFKDINDLGVASTRKGWQKIAECCRRAVSDGYDWVWMDTCCIDKSSSAELSEAINSMWQYYRQSQQCYVYLADVPLPTSQPVTENNLLTDDRLLPGQADGDWPAKLAASRWFTRGWTLQELLAPLRLLFLAQDWSALGKKQDLSKTIESITGIQSPYLLDWSGHTAASIACKMSWAAKRKTTRTEDMAYCLLGLFDVNMPLLYGEGKRAFRRLQLEVINVYTDQSIFAWRYGGPLSSGQLEHPRGILAEAPSWFADCGSVVDDSSLYGITPSTVSNAGIRLSSQVGPLPLLNYQSKYRYDMDSDLRHMALTCAEMGEDGVRKRVGIALRMVGQMVEREVPKARQTKGNPIQTAVRAFPDYVHTAWRGCADSYKTVYLQLD